MTDRVVDSLRRSSSLEDLETRPDSLFDPLAPAAEHGALFTGHGLSSLMDGGTDGDLTPILGVRVVSTRPSRTDAGEGEGSHQLRDEKVSAEDIIQYEGGSSLLASSALDSEGLKPFSIKAPHNRQPLIVKMQYM